MKYPMEKYRFITTDKMVIAISTYAGKNVKGVAKADPRDTFDIEKGKLLAASRCNAKIARKRAMRAKRKYAEAEKLLAAAQKHMKDMDAYYKDAKAEYAVSLGELTKIEASM